MSFEKMYRCIERRRIREGRVAQRGGYGRREGPLRRLPALGKCELISCVISRVLFQREGRLH